MMALAGIKSGEIKLHYQWHIYKLTTGIVHSEWTSKHGFWRHFAVLRQFVMSENISTLHAPLILPAIQTSNRKQLTNNKITLFV